MWYVAALYEKGIGRSHFAKKCNCTFLSGAVWPLTRGLLGSVSCHLSIMCPVCERGHEALEQQIPHGTAPTQEVLL